MSEQARRVRGTIALIADKCTSCMLCARECPDWCIEIDSHQELVSEPGARRPRTVNVLDRFEIDWGLCLYCGICIEVCPFDALEWVEPGTAAAKTAEGLAHGIAELSAHPQPGA